MCCKIESVVDLRRPNVRRANQLERPDAFVQQTINVSSVAKRPSQVACERSGALHVHEVVDHIYHGDSVEYGEFPHMVSLYTCYAQTSEVVR